MFRNFAQPINTAVFKFNIRIYPFCNGLVYNGCFFFFVEFEQAFFIGNEFVYLGCFTVEIVGYGGLFLK
jgi:hypothetical protein